MGAGHELAFVQLELKEPNDPLTETITKLIVEIAQTGEKDASMICARALSLLRDERKAS